MRCGLSRGLVPVPLWPVQLAPPEGDTAPPEAAEGVRRILPKKKKTLSRLKIIRKVLTNILLCAILVSQINEEVRNRG